MSDMSSWGETPSNDNQGSIWGTPIGQPNNGPGFGYGHEPRSNEYGGYTEGVGGHREYGNSGNIYDSHGSWVNSPNGNSL